MNTVVALHSYFNEATGRQHDSELSCHKVNVRTILLLFFDFVMLALFPTTKNGFDQHF